MKDKWYSLKCRIALAQELEIPPDDLLVESVLTMVEDTYIAEKNGDYTANIFPDTSEQEEAVISNYYDIILGRIFQNQAPFEGFIQHIMSERGII